MVFQAVITASVRAAKDGERAILAAIASENRLLETATLLWLRIADEIAGAFDPDSLIFVPDSLDGMESNCDLKWMSDLGGSSMEDYLPSEFMFTRMNAAQSGLREGQRISLPLEPSPGRMVRCGSAEANDYITRVVRKWARRVRETNGIC